MDVIVQIASYCHNYHKWLMYIFIDNNYIVYIQLFTHV